jgi:hypothetical protein
MPSQLPTSLPGDTLRKAIQEYCDLMKKDPDSSHKKRLQSVSVKFDLSPLQCEFLDKQLKSTR